MRIGGICLNWKVVAGLGAVGLVVLIVAPGASRSVLPLLLLAACPLSMVAMMWAMRGMHGKQQTTRGQVEPDQPSSREQQLAQLRGQLTDVDARQAALAAYVRALEEAEVADGQAPSGGPSANGLPTQQGSRKGRLS